MKLRRRLDPLFAAKGAAQIVELLLAAGVDVNLKDGGYLDTALHHAVADERVEVVRVLIAHGANVNIANKKGETPYALSRDGGEIRAILVSAGAKP